MGRYFIFADRLSQTGQVRSDMAAVGYSGSDPGVLVQPVRRGGIRTGGVIMLPMHEQ